jgi:hypothetical protein
MIHILGWRDSPMIAGTAAAEHGDLAKGDAAALIRPPMRGALSQTPGAVS